MICGNCGPAPVSASNQPPTAPDLGANVKSWLYGVDDRPTVPTTGAVVAFGGVGRTGC